MSDQHESTQAATPAYSRWRDSLLWLLVSIVVLVLSVNGVMVWVATQVSPNLVRSDYYEASKHVDEEQAARASSTRLGWQVQEGVAAGAVTVRVTDRDGQPVGGLAGTVHAYRPSDATLDQRLTWEELAGASGAYLARFSRPRPGLWRITLDVARGDDRLYQDLVVVVR